jgi:hypothetical protein
MIRRHLLTETIANAHEVRIQDYDGVRSKLVDLGADKPNDDCPNSKAGGVCRRELVSVPAMGLGSPRQNIPRGDAAKGAYKDRHFTDQNCAPESKEGQLHSIVRMRRRSCHFCNCRMRLDPCDDANDQKNPCQYEELRGPADNVVAVAREKDRSARVTRSASVALSALSDPFHAGISPFPMPAFQVNSTDCTARLWWFLPRPIQLPPLLSVLAHQTAGPMPPASPRSAMSLARSVRMHVAGSGGMSRK